MELKDIIGANIKKYKELKGLNSKELAEQIGVSKATVTYWEKGINQPSAEKVVNICNVLGVTPEMIYDTSSWTGDISDKTLFQMADIADKALNGLRIPVLGSIHAGIPNSAIEDIVDYEDITEEMARHGKHFALKIKGNSMFPNLLEDDVVIFRECEDAENGDVCAVLVNGDEATVKKVKKTEQGIALIPFNTTDYEPMFFTNDDIEKKPVRIIGKAVEIRRSL